MQTFDGRTLLKKFNTAYSLEKSSVDKFSKIPSYVKDIWEKEYSIANDRKFNIDVKLYKGVCTIDISKFGGGHCISIVKSDGSHEQVCTTHDSLGKDEVVIREFGDLEGITKFLVKNKIVKKTNKTIFMWSMHLPIATLITSVNSKNKGKKTENNNCLLYEALYLNQKNLVISSIKSYCNRKIVKYNFTEKAGMPFTIDGEVAFVKTPVALICKKGIGISYIVNEFDYDFDDIENVDIELLLWINTQLLSGSYTY